MRRRTLVLAPVTALAGILLGSQMWVAWADNSSASGQPYVVRETFTERVDSKNTSVEVVAETWTLIGSNGHAQEMVGLYRDVGGQLVQAQHRTKDYELVYWGSYQDNGAACVERAPAHPRGLEGLVPAIHSASELGSQGYTLGGQPGEPALSLPPAPSSKLLTSRTFDLSGATVWTKEEQDPTGSGERRTSVLAVDDSGLGFGYWSVSRGASGEQLNSNSSVSSSLETYDASIFGDVLGEVNFDGTPNCNYS